MLEFIAPGRLGRAFRFVLASSWISNLGDGFALAAGPLLVASDTRSPTLVALATLLQRLPWLAFSLLAGGLADRKNRVAIVVAADVLRAASLVGLAAAIFFHHASIALILGVMFFLGVAEVFSNTAFNTLLPSIVERADLTLANSRLQAGFVTVNQLIGPPLGAALFAAGRPSPFIAQAVLVSAGVFLVARVKLRRLGAPSVDQRPRGETIAGLKWVSGNAPVRTLVITILIFNVTFGAAWSVLVLWARQRLGVGPVGFGLLITAGAIGGIAGTVCYGWITKHVTLGNLMRAGLIIETFTHLAFALTRSFALAVCVMAVFGAHAFIWGTTAITVRQRAVPDAMQGRVTGVDNLATFGGLVVGAAIGGPIAAHWGITAPFWFGFVGSLAFLVILWRQLTHIAHADAA